MNFLISLLVLLTLYPRQNRHAQVDLLGTWKLEKYVADGDTLNSLPKEYSETWTFYPDGSYKNSSANLYQGSISRVEETGKYKIEGQNLIHIFNRKQNYLDLKDSTVTNGLYHAPDYNMEIVTLSNNLLILKDYAKNGEEGIHGRSYYHRQYK